MSTLPPAEEIFFDVATPLNFWVRTTVNHWALITTIKHPVMAGREAEVMATLMTPDEVRVSKSDTAVYLFYRSDGLRRWVCVVVRKENGGGFLITAYRTSAIKEGEQVWRK